MIDALPPSYRRYHEPFLGSGALFFLLQPEEAELGDSCAELIETYLAVRDRPTRVLEYLRPWRPSRDLFYAIRSNPSTGRFKRAAEFIYLNRTCWNGLYRVSGKGNFNVPYGWPKTDNIVDEENIVSCGRALRKSGVSLKMQSFEECVASVQACDLVFLDPPYVTAHNNNGFIDYNEKLFSWEDQVRLADLARSLVQLGASVIVTNAYHDELLELYRGFDHLVIERYSTLASSAKKRKPVQEAVLWRHARDTGGTTDG